MTKAMVDLLIDRSLSAVESVPGRTIREVTARELIARAAGRCQFRGCNEFLYEHPLTGEVGNFAEHAHIVAFREHGPRGQDGERPTVIHDISNLMLLCAPCHKLIDDNPEQYPRHELEAHKHEHQTRIKRLTELGPSMQTAVVQLKTKVGTSVVDVAPTEIFQAVYPRYPSGDATVIDLTDLGDEKGGARYDLAAERIQEEVTRLYTRTSRLQNITHLSVFGLAPMPLLMTLGSALSNKVATDFFQCHRNRPDRWTWFEGAQPVQYTVHRIRVGSDVTKVALVLSLSGVIHATSLPADLDNAFTVYEITLAGVAPNTGFLRQREDLEAFRHAYRDFLAQLRGSHPGLHELQVFPAVPAPVAIVCGFDLLPKVDPTLVVYDNVVKDGGFIQRLRINDHERK